MKRERYRLLQNILKSSEPKDWLCALQNTEKGLSGKQWHTSFFICPILITTMVVGEGMREEDVDRQIRFWYRSLKKDFPDLPWYKGDNPASPWFSAGLNNERLAIVRHLISELKRIYKLED